MGYIAKEPLTRHSAIYAKGQEVKDLTEAEVKRLLDLGVIEEGTAAAPGETADVAQQQSQSAFDRAKAALTGHPNADQVAADAAQADGRQI